MSTAVRRARKLLGRRGAALLLLGVSHVCFGLGYVFQPEVTSPGLAVLTRWLDLHCWAFVWLVCGAAAFASAWLRVGRDWLGFFAALMPPFLWGAAFLWSALTGDYPRGLAVAAWYVIGHVGLILWAATVPEFSLPRPVRRERK